MKTFTMTALILAALVIGALVGQSFAQEEAFDKGMKAGVEYQEWFCNEGSEK